MKKTLLTTLKENIEIIDTPAMLLGMYKGILTREDLTQRQKRYLEIKILRTMNDMYYRDKKYKWKKKTKLD